jgi:hypothetical protein
LQARTQCAAACRESAGNGIIDTKLTTVTNEPSSAHYSSQAAPFAQIAANGPGTYVWREETTTTMTTGYDEFSGDMLSLFA